MHFSLFAKIGVQHRNGTSSVICKDQAEPGWPYFRGCSSRISPMTSGKAERGRGLLQRLSSCKLWRLLKVFGKDESLLYCRDTVCSLVRFPKLSGKHVSLLLWRYNSCKDSSSPKFSGNFDNLLSWSSRVCKDRSSPKLSGRAVNSKLCDRFKSRNF